MPDVPSESTPSHPLMLGQELFRAALHAENLEPFDVAIDAARLSESPLDQANILKAVRFGLAGMVLHGMAPRITTHLPPRHQVPFARSTLEHKFRRGVVASHDPTVVDERLSPESEPRIVRTQGEEALRNISNGLTKLAERYLAPTWWARRRRIAAGIRVGHVLTRISAAVALEQQLRPNIPDSYINGIPQFQEFYIEGVDGRTNELIIPDPAKPLARAVSNPIRFSQVQIVKTMEQLAATDLGDHAAAHAEHVLLGIVRHMARASQRQDGVELVPDAEALIPDSRSFTLIQTANGTYEPTWHNKDKPPSKHVAPGAPPPTTGMALGTDRNRCPIGYTPDAFTPMPIAGITSAILYYLKQNGLHQPRMFMSPQVIIARR